MLVRLQKRELLPIWRGCNYPDTEIVLSMVKHSFEIGMLITETGLPQQKPHITGIQLIILSLFVPHLKVFLSNHKMEAWVTTFGQPRILAE